MASRFRRPFAFSCALLLLSDLAFAGPLVSGTVSAARIEEGTSVAATGAFTYQFNRAVGLGIELTYIPSLKPDVPLIPEILATELAAPSVSTTIFPAPIVLPRYIYSADGGHSTIFSTNLRLEIPTTSARMLPYVIAGGGVGTVKENVVLTVDYPDVVIQSGGALGLTPIRSISQRFGHSFTDLALTLGGGVSFRTTEHLWIDVDLRYLGMFGDKNLHVGRFGGGVTYRF